MMPIINNFKKSVLLIALFGVLSACSSFSKKDNIHKPSELVDFTQSIAPVKAWSAKAGAGKGKQLIGLEAFVSGDELFYADHEGKVFSFNRDTGKLNWKVDLNKPVSGAISGQDNYLALGTIDGEVLVLNTTGEVQWTGQVSSEIITSPIVFDNRVIVRSQDGRVYGFDLESGERVWIYDTAVPLLSLRGNAEPIARAGIVMIPFDSGKMVGLRVEDGVIQWEKLVAQPDGRNEIERLVDLDGHSGIVAATVYVAGYNGNSAALSIESGKVIWSQKNSSGTGVSVARSRVYLSTDDGVVKALSRDTGTTIWEQKALKYRGLSNPVQFDDYVVVGDEFGYLHWMDAETGRFVYRTKIDSSGISSALISKGGRLFVISNDATIVAFDAPN
ncbi:MAG: outer membrane protein assembly factor BamB [bacterium]